MFLIIWRGLSQSWRQSVGEPSNHQQFYRSLPSGSLWSLTRIKMEGLFRRFFHPSADKANRQTLQDGGSWSKHFSAGVLLLQPDPTKMTCSMTDMVNKRRSIDSHGQFSFWGRTKNTKKHCSIVTFHCKFQVMPLMNAEAFPGWINIHVW